jgi:hypothetical protein
LDLGHLIRSDPLSFAESLAESNALDIEFDQPLRLPTAWRGSEISIGLHGYQKMNGKNWYKVCLPKMNPLSSSMRRVVRP